MCFTNCYLLKVRYKRKGNIYFFFGCGACQNKHTKVAFVGLAKLVMFETSTLIHGVIIP